MNIERVKQIVVADFVPDADEGDRKLSFDILSVVGHIEWGDGESVSVVELDESIYIVTELARGQLFRIERLDP